MLKWGGTVVCVSVAVAWIGSTFLFVRVPYRKDAAVGLRGGGVILLRGRSEVGGPMVLTVRRETGYGFGLHGPYWGSSTWRAGGTTSLRWYPLWPALLTVGPPTAFLWGIDWWIGRRRFPPGHCQKCGYDLTGNVSGRCPECGKAAS